VRRRRITVRIPDKLGRQASEQLDEAVLAAAMVVPPGATLYGSFSPNARVLGGGGPIAEAVMSKKKGAAAGDAGSVPTCQGVLAVTADRVIYFKKKMWGVGVGKQLAEWRRSAITFVHEPNGRFSYPGLLLEFADGSTCVVFGQKNWGLDRIATAS